MKKIVLAFAASAVLAYAGNSEITAVFGRAHQSDSSKFDDHNIYGIRIGAGIEDSWIDQLEIGYDYSKNAKYTRITPPKEEESNIHRVYLNVIKELDVAESAKIYALVGAGYTKYSKDKDLPAESNSAIGQYGAGLKLYLSDNIALKTELRHGIRIKTPHKNSLFYSVGLAYSFGAKTESPVITEVPVQQPTAVPTITVDEQPAAPAVAEQQKPKVEPVITKNGEIKGTIIKTIPLTQQEFAFALNSADIPVDGVSILKTLADELTSAGNENVKVLVEGHTDSTGSASYNLRLSQKRADAVKNNFVSNGVAEDRIISKGYGETKPVQPNETADGRAANRRVEVIFVK
jgi:OOP family OmpA-OmpF porin